MTVSTVLLTPISRGSVSLRRQHGRDSTVDVQTPEIVLNQLREPLDSKLFSQAILKAANILNSQALAPYLQKPNGVHFSPEELVKFMREGVSTRSCVISIEDHLYNICSVACRRYMRHAHKVQ